MTSRKDLYKVVADGMGGISNNPTGYTLLPYAKDLTYTEGLLRFTLTFFNEKEELNMTLGFQLAPEMVENIREILDDI
jgi:hypothetical protein